MIQRVIKRNIEIVDDINEKKKKKKKWKKSNYVNKKWMIKALNLKEIRNFCDEKTRDWMKQYGFENFSMMKNWWWLLWLIILLNMSLENKFDSLFKLSTDWQRCLL